MKGDGGDDERRLRCGKLTNNHTNPAWLVILGGSSGFKSQPRGCALKPKNHTAKIFAPSHKNFRDQNFLVITLCSLTWAVHTLGIPYGEFYSILIEDS